ncbi:MAG TPA: glycoside hydrolase family 38 C-terminal domain-containing protein, partial [Chthonomonadaceae bacterium]|nr:glycoside hydrolase family 38 C-terminal domain-containing protein [Chthonomonadaceae bacterium]
RWCALATLVLGRPYPADQFAHAWKRLLFEQFHDVLAGTSLPAAYDDAQEHIGEACAIASRLQNADLQALAAHIDTTLQTGETPGEARGRPILLLNPSSWERTDRATEQWGWHGEIAARLVDEDGREVPYQYTQPDIFGDGSRILFEATVPANGFRVYRLLPGAPAASSSESELQIGETWLENARWRLEFDPAEGHLTRHYDKVHDVETLSGPACVLRVMKDPGDTWGHNIASWREEVGQFGSAQLKIIENGPALVTLRIETRWQSSTARQEFTLYRHSPRIDVALTIDWHERHKMLKLSVPVAIQQGTLTYDAPYSAIIREANGLEDPGQAWMDLSGTAATGSGASRAYGVSLLNDSKYGFDCLGSDLRMSLLRSPIFCFHDPAQVEAGRDYLYMDQGPQTLHYSLLPHTGDWREGDSARQAHALNNPLQTLFQYPHPGDWGPSGSLLEVAPSHVIAAALKGAEDGPDIILRLFESQGRPTPATVTLPGNRRFEIPMAAWELKTLRISSSGAIREVNLLEE